MENLMFDYISLGKNLDVPMEIVQKFEKEARSEFPFDTMLMEIHVLRAIKAYAKINTRMMAKYARSLFCTTF
ncbi:hypothetical protein ACYULU_13785 [Breznakiellaceae bacterium SP9]